MRESLMAREAESAGMRKRVASLLDERTGAYAEMDLLKRELHARDTEVLNATKAREEAEIAMRDAEQAKVAQAKDASKNSVEMSKVFSPPGIDLDTPYRIVGTEKTETIIPQAKSNQATLQCGTCFDSNEAVVLYSRCAKK